MFAYSELYRLIGSKFSLNKNANLALVFISPSTTAWSIQVKRMSKPKKKSLEKSTSYLTLFFPELCVLTLCAPCLPACLFVCLYVGVVVTLLTTFIGIDLVSFFGAFFPIVLLLPLPRFLAGSTSDLGVDILDSIDARPFTTDDLMIYSCHIKSKLMLPVLSSKSSFPRRTSDVAEWIDIDSSIDNLSVCSDGLSNTCKVETKCRRAGGVWSSQYSTDSTGWQLRGSARLRNRCHPYFDPEFDELISLVPGGVVVAADVPARSHREKESSDFLLPHWKDCDRWLRSMAKHRVLPRKACVHMHHHPLSNPVPHVGWGGHHLQPWVAGIVAVHLLL